MKKIFLLIVFITYFFLGCREDKYPVSSLYDPADTLKTQNISDTVYVHQNPDWYGFNGPRAIIVGNEPFVYVADTYNNRIVMIDIAGNVKGYSKFIKRPIALAQNNKLQLLVCAEFDTLISGVTTTFGAIYKVDLPSANHNIDMIIPKRVIYEPGDASRRYTAIATFYDNSYYVGRIGPKNSSTSYDRDNAILQFGSNDVLFSPVTSDFAPYGSGIKSIHSVTALATVPGGKSVEFAFAQITDDPVLHPLLFKVQWFRFIIDQQTSYFTSKFWPSSSSGVGLVEENKFGRPSGIAFDASSNLYVVDAETDSLYRFNSKGIERYSFGGHNDPYGRTLNEPSGVAYFVNTIFIADKGNNRICRYKLSIDMK
jgi:hypothetical protein